MKKYNIINNSLGWFCFLVAAITYILTLEPTASFWDCPEFISQGYKLEVGHPPGNPIFMLTARFFINFAGGDPSNVAVAVNMMSALLSAGTILLLFWTITHLVRRMMVGRSQEALSWTKTAIIMGSGLCGALMYTWSDTFWFSAVEGEVYAFSSFCTALVFWLILKWDNRADNPGSDRYLILIAYVIGISIAVHLLNLLTIPAIGLVVYFRKSKSSTLKGVLLALAVSIAIVALILYGIVPGFIKIAGWFELFCVNTLGMSFNMGVLIYAVVLVGVLVWCIYTLYRQSSPWMMRISFTISVLLSGMLFISGSWIIALILLSGLAYWVFFSRRLSVRLMLLTALSITVIFAGYSSYALLLIRSAANPPMNQNAPDNVFALASYLNREQYGETPLLYGPTFASMPKYTVDITTDALGQPNFDYNLISHDGKSTWNKQVKNSPSDPDRYVETSPKQEYEFVNQMFFPRMYSSQPEHVAGYLKWIGESEQTMPTEEVNIFFNKDGSDFTYYGQKQPYKVMKPTFAQNLRYFFRYQLNHMYWRYFMWNFAGRQNDLQGNGELTRGNWISGIDFLDNPRLGDQSLLPDELGKDNKGHNVFYMLPLLMGLLGIALQMVRGQEGIHQFWIIFLLFFMTGIAIVLYLNQYPGQPRERDYAFAGSFYAFAIWVGMGVYGLWLALRAAFGKKLRDDKKVVMGATIASVAVGLFVPLQVVSQTWDDHDRSGRYTTRDFGMNYLASVDENGIIFTNGDNDTFPLWYAQEVEGYRTDVRVVNLAYLATDWYANQLRVPSYDGQPVPMTASPADYALDRLIYNKVVQSPENYRAVSVFDALNDIYHSPSAVGTDTKRIMRYPNMYIPINPEDAVKAGVLPADLVGYVQDYINVDLSPLGNVTLSQLLSLDIIASGAQDGWKRPTYFAMTVPDDYYLGLKPYMLQTGLAYQVTPMYYDVAQNQEPSPNYDKMYDIVVNKFKWGGLDKIKNSGNIYLDETVRRMVTTHRSALANLADELSVYEQYDKALEILNLIEEKLPTSVSPYALQMGQEIADIYKSIGILTNDNKVEQKGQEILAGEIKRYAQYIPYFYSMLKEQPAYYNKTVECPRYDPSTGRQTTYRKTVQVPSSILNLDINDTEKFIPQYLLMLIADYCDYSYIEDNERAEKILRQTIEKFGINYHQIEALQIPQDSNNYCNDTPAQSSAANPYGQSYYSYGDEYDYDYDGGYDIYE